MSVIVDYSTSSSNSNTNEDEEGEILESKSFSKISNYEFQFYDRQSFIGPSTSSCSGIITPEMDEPPLLDELEIYPEQIVDKICFVLKPAKIDETIDLFVKEPDIVGPICLFVILGTCLFLAGNKVHFSYIYGLTVTLNIIMYILLNIMTTGNGKFPLNTVICILGYSNLPIVLLSLVGVFVTLQSCLGFLLASAAVLWSCLSAAALFVEVSGDTTQKPLITYPCALVAGIYALLTVF